MECVQEDRSNPLPCTDADKRDWPNGQAPQPTTPTPETTQKPATTDDQGESDEDLEAAIMGKKKPEIDAGATAAPPAEDSEDELMRKIMGGSGGADASVP